MAVCAVLTGLTTPAVGQFEPFGGGEKQTYNDSRDVVDVAVHLDRTKVAPGGQIIAAVMFDHDQGWHVQAHASDDPDVITTTLSAASSDPARLKPHNKHIQWPKIHYGEYGGLGEVPVFSGKAIAYVPITVPPDVSSGEVSLTITTRFQACDDTLCMRPAEQTFEKTVSVIPLSELQQSGSDADGGADASIFGGFDQSVWRDIAAGVEYVAFDLFGIITFDLNVGSWLGFVLLLIVAAIGGFLLNLTPCVLPVIPIKIIGLSQAAQGSRMRTIALGVAMTVGVLFFWLVLGGLIAGVRGFTATNQLFQYPVFTVTVGLIIIAMAVGMCGLFAVRLPQSVYMFNPSHETMHGSFLFGIMTAILSTPCTAPFMGAAAAWAATQHPAVTLSAFAAIGGGMALPYLILSIWPQMAERMPRTGPASELIKQVMGLLLLAAGLYFLGNGLSGWFVTPPDPPSKLYWWAVAVTGVAAGAWLVWRTIHLTNKTVNRTVFGVIGAVVVLISATVGFTQSADGPVNWTYYTPERFDAALDDGNVVVMDFTAEWCLNCKALEQTVLYRPRVAELLNSEGVSAIKVDLTGNNTTGKAMLQKVNRLTIPLLVVFAPDGTEVFKGDFYTVDQVIKAVEQARNGQVAAR